MHGVVSCACAAVTDADLRWARQSEGVPSFLPSPSPISLSLPPTGGLLKRANIRHGLFYATRRSLGDTVVLVLKLPFFEEMALS